MTDAAFGIHAEAAGRARAWRRVFEACYGSGVRPSAVTRMSTARAHEGPKVSPGSVSPSVPSPARRLTYAAYAGAIAIAVAFVLLVLPELATVPHDFDEAWLILDARAMARGLRPFVDFPHHEMPLHLYLLLGFGQLFGDTLVGYRLLSVASLAGSGILLFCLARPYVGVLPALVAEVAFLWSPTLMHALPAIPETPTVFCTLLGVTLLFLGARWGSAVASGAVLVLALFIKPSCLFMVIAAAVSLAIGREWRRLGQVALGGAVTAISGLALFVYLSDGVFAEQIWFTLTRVLTRSAGMWTIDSGFAEMRGLTGLDTPFKWAFSTMQGFFQLRVTWIPMGLFVVSLLALPIWVVRCARSRRSLQAFVVLWPVGYCVANFVAVDFVSPRYFVSFLAFSGFFLAGWFWLAQRWLPAIAVAAAGMLLGVALVSELASALQTERDPWYWARADFIVHRYASVVSFSPMLFAATGAEPGCDFANPALAYGSFGENLLLTEHALRFRVSDTQLVDCLKAHPEIPVVVDWAFYFFTRPGSALRRYLAEEGSAQRFFFSPEAAAQWDQPLLRMDPFR